jgi:general secretion pathway protein J
MTRPGLIPGKDDSPQTENPAKQIPFEQLNLEIGPLRRYLIKTIFIGNRHRLYRNRNAVRQAEQYYSHQQGFTLLELILAVSMLLMIALLIAEAMRLGVRAVDAGSGKADHLERFRMTIYMMNSQVESHFPPLRKTDSEAAASSFSGDARYLRFTTNHSIWSGKKGYVIAAYRIESAGDGKQSLYAEESGIHTVDRRETLLIGGLDEISFAYCRRDVIREEEIWTPVWLEPETVPDKIRIQILFKGKQFSLIFPLRVRHSAGATLMQGDTEVMNGLQNENR